MNVVVSATVEIAAPREMLVRLIRADVEEARTQRRDMCTFEVTASGTRWTQVRSTDVSGRWSWLLAPFARRRLRRETEQTMARTKALLESLPAVETDELFPA